MTEIEYANYLRLHREHAHYFESSVHPPESSVSEPQARLSDPDSLIPPGTSLKRGADARLLWKLGASAAAVQRFCDCGRRYLVYREPGPPARIHVVPQRCRHRLCPTCNRLLAAEWTSSLSRELKRQQVRLITLTLAADGECLKHRWDRLLASFRRLRSHPQWKSHVRGAIAAVELTWNAEHTNWHVHLHVLAIGTFFPQPMLKSLWHNVTGDSTIVDVRQVTRRAGAIRYVTKYIAKPLHDSVARDLERLREYFVASRDRKRMIRVGCLHGLRRRERPEERHWKLLGDVDELLDYWRGGNGRCQPWELDALEAWKAEHTGSSGPAP